MIALSKADKLIFVTALSLLVVLYLVFWTADSAAQQVEILVDGEKRYVYDLRDEKTINIEGRLGTSVIRIENGKVRFLNSSCSSKLCIRSGWHEHAGSLLACLPNGVSVHLQGGSKMYDAINF